MYNLAPPAPSLSKRSGQPATHNGLAPRRGKQLHINTDIPVPTPPTNAIPTIQRPPPIETVIYKTSPEESNAPVRLAPELVSRSASRLGLRGIFKSKSTKNTKHDPRRDPIAEEAQVSTQISSKSPFFSPPPREPIKEKAPPTRLKATRKEQPQRPSTTWDPPPLFQAYPQAVKSGTLDTPVQSAEVVLRTDRARQTVGDRSIPVQSQQLVADWHDYPSDDEGGTEKKPHKRQPSSFVECASKTYVLTTSGFLLQYSSQGSYDRLPEKIMQLGKDSAAFASDAIPGQHWVLQISQSFSEDGTATNDLRKSIFPRFGLGGNMKRAVSNFLLVMNNAEDMNSWLVAMRREIQGLGGQTYRPDEAVRSNAQDAIQRLKDRPSRRFLIERSTSRNSNLSATASPILSHRSSMILPQARSVPGTEGLPHRPSFASQRSGGSISQSTGLHAEEALTRRSPGRRASSTHLTSASSGGTDMDEAPPAMPTSMAFSPINALSPVDALGIVSGRQPHARNSPSIRPPIFDENSPPAANFSRPRSMIPPSFCNVEVRTFNDNVRTEETETRKGSIGSSDSTRAPNFSVPSFSRRYPPVERSSEDTMTSSGSGTTSLSRGRTPSLTDDGDSTRPESIVGELPPSTRSVQRPIFQGQTETAVAVSMSPVRAKQIETEVPEFVSIPIEHQPRIPRRLSSLEYANGNMPWSALPDSATLASVSPASSSPRPKRFSSLPPAMRSVVSTPLVEPPCPPSVSALPPLPPSAASIVEPSPRHSLYRKVSPSVPSSDLTLSPPHLRQAKSTNLRPNSPRKIKSTASMATLNPSLAPPMTIQERRMLLNKKSAALAGAPTLPPLVGPPPSGALPPPPGAPPCIPLPPVPSSTLPAQSELSHMVAAQVLPRGAGPVAPPTPPTRETPPSQSLPTFDEIRKSWLPDSPPNFEEQSDRPHKMAEMQCTPLLQMGSASSQGLSQSAARELWDQH
jgi:hypothetical protein